MNRTESAQRARRIAAITSGTVLMAVLSMGALGCTVDGTLPSTDGSVVQVSATAHETRTITVTGTQSTMVVPDQADVNFCIQVLSPTAEEGQAEVARTLDSVKEACAGMGIEAAQVKTGTINSWERYDYSGDKQELMGYQMELTFAVEQLSCDQVGSVIATVTGCGVNQVQGVRYYSSTYDDDYAAALQQALAAARTKAESIAAANGQVIVAAQQVTEGWQDMTYATNSETVMYAKDEAATAEGLDSDAGGIGMDPGTVQIEATVTVTYEVE